MVEMELVGVRLELPGNTPVILMRELAATPRLLPIFIGHPEAAAIAFAMEGVVPPRPMTHDLFADVLEKSGSAIEKIVITDLDKGTFFAELHLLVGETRTVTSCRPSDAVALAVRVGCPIFAEESVLDEAAISEQPPVEGESEDVVEAFREFIESVDPEDFAS